MHPLPCQGETQRESGTFFFDRFSDFWGESSLPVFYWIIALFNILFYLNSVSL